MFDWLISGSWSPYVVGTGIGILVWMTFLFSDRPLGVSTAYAKTAGMVEKAISRKNVESMPYYHQVTPEVDWQWTIMIGVIIGGFISSYTAGTLAVNTTPPLFAAKFGTDMVFRFGVALVGGIIMGIGARWAGGCTSGHGISGTIQLSLASWVAVICFFAGGVLTAGLLFGYRFL